MAKHLFIIDDDQEIRAILQELLEGEAYEGEIANDGLIAWTTFPTSAKAMRWSCWI